MRIAGLRGIARWKNPRTTITAADTGTPADLVNRRFVALAPDQIWVAGITYVRTFAGWANAAFVTDVLSRWVVGWRQSTSLHTDLALGASERGISNRKHTGQDLSRLIHYSDRGVQYRAIRYTQRLADAGVVASVGSRDNSYDGALAEAFNSLFKAELVRSNGPWKSIDDLEIAVAAYIDWFNHRRLHGEIGMIPPVEAEQSYYHSQIPT